MAQDPLVCAEECMNSASHLVHSQHTDFSTGTFRIMSEHIVVFLGWDPMIPFLLWVSFARVSLPASVTTEGSLSSRGFSSSTCSGSRQAFGVDEDTSSSSNPSVDGFHRSNTVSSTSSSRSKCPLAGENAMDGTAFCLVTASTETKFSMLHSIGFLPFDYLGLLTATSENNLDHGIVLPTTALTVNLPPNVPIDKRRAPGCRPWLACLRPQCHRQSECPRFCLTVE